MLPSPCREIENKSKIYQSKYDNKRHPRDSRLRRTRRYTHSLAKQKAVLKALILSLHQIATKCQDIRCNYKIGCRIESLIFKQETLPQKQAGEVIEHPYDKQNLKLIISYQRLFNKYFCQFLLLLKLIYNSTITIMKAEEKKIFQDIFHVTAIDPGNKTPFRNVSRIHMSSEYKLQMQIDIHSQIYPLAVGTKLYAKAILSENIRNAYTKQQLARVPEKDNFEYIMYGVVFELEDSGQDLTVFASFGGLIMKLKGKKVLLAGFRKEGVQARIYLMIRKA